MTILFKQDWNKYPTAIVDVDTPNKSFVRLAAMYRDMGVSNHAFILSLVNPELRGIDPHDPNLTIDQMMMIAAECKNNFWYYLREVVRVPGGTDANPICFRANRGSIALYWLFFNHILVMLIQIRQTGKSFSTDVLMRYLTNIKCKNTSINLLTKDDTLRSSNLARLKEVENEFPFYLRQRTPSDISNSEEYTVKSLNNTYKGHLPNKSPKAALNVGRGLTSPIFQVDEAAFFYNIGLSLPAALAAGTAARDLARMNDDPYGTIITTTAGKIDDVDGQYIYNMLSHSAVWTEKFFDCVDIEDLEKIVRLNCPTGSHATEYTKKGSLRVNCTFNHNQLGYTDEWLEKALEESNAVGEAADRDFFNRWTSGSKTNPIPVTILEIIRKSQNNEPLTDITHPYSYILRWYVGGRDVNEFMSTGVYTIGLDTSDAGGGDDIGLVLRSVTSGAVVATGNFNETNLITFSEWLTSIITVRLNVTMIIERRSSGMAIIDYLLLMLPVKNVDPFKRLYNTVVQDHVEYPDRFRDIAKPMFARSNEIYVKYKKYFGFATSALGATSRSELYSITLLNAAKLTGDSVHDAKLVDQITSLITTSAGRVDHPPGGNDDLVIAWLLSYWLLSLGKNLAFYGIDAKKVLSEITITKPKEIAPLEHYEQKEQTYLRSVVEELVAKLQEERDGNVAYILEQKLKQAISRLSDDDRKMIAVDELINSINEFKKNKYGDNRNSFYR